MKLSKTEARNNITNEIYDGWDDPRTWSLQSLEKRGIKPEALKKTLTDLGMSMTGITFDETWLYAKNKDIIDKDSNRYFYVEDPIQVTIKAVPFSDYISEPYLLPSKPEKGKRKINVRAEEGKLDIFLSNKDAKSFKLNQILRLKDLMNIEIKSIDLPKNKIEAIYHSTELNRDYSILHWVLKSENVKISVLKPDGKVSEGYGEKNLLKIPLNQTIQFERFGFVNPIRWDKDSLICYFTH
jgi:glutamyl-tRNA synthetase